MPGEQVVDPDTGGLLFDNHFNTELRDRMLWLGGETGILTQLVPTAITQDFVWSSPVGGDIPGASVMLQTSGNSPILLVCSGPGHSRIMDSQVRFTQDGADGEPAAIFAAGGQLNLPFTVLGLYAPTPGVHTYTLRASVQPGGTLTMNFSLVHGVLAAIELRR